MTPEPSVVGFLGVLGQPRSVSPQRRVCVCVHIHLGSSLKYVVGLEVWRKDCVLPLCFSFLLMSMLELMTWASLSTFSLGLETSEQQDVPNRLDKMEMMGFTFPEVLKLLAICGVSKEKRFQLKITKGNLN